MRIPPPEFRDSNKDLEKAYLESEGWPNEISVKGQVNKNKVHFLEAVYWATVVAVFVVVFLFLGALIAVSAHYLLPEKWSWLTDNQISKIQAVLFSGTMGSIVSITAQRLLSK